jgi:hypothetical protein
MPSPIRLLCLASALLVGCGSESPAPPKGPDAFAVFPQLPLPPEAKLVSRAGSADALQLTMFTPGKADAVTDYYRDQLSTGKWRLVGDVRKSDGSVALYAEREGHPLWVRIWPTSDSAGTMVELAGALVGKGTAVDSVSPAGPTTAPNPKK